MLQIVGGAALILTAILFLALRMGWVRVTFTVAAPKDATPFGRPIKG